MHTFTIQPLVGIGPIKFGMSRNEVQAILAEFGQTQTVLRPPNTDCYFQNAFQVSYDEAGEVEFIEFASSSDVRILFHEASLHELTAEDAVRFVSQFADYDKNHRDQGFTYIFPACQLSLWRSVLPADADDEDGRHFEAVGIGKPGYFSS